MRQMEIQSIPDEACRQCVLSTEAYEAGDIKKAVEILAEARDAAIEFFADKPGTLMPSPTGQAIYFR